MFVSGALMHAYVVYSRCHSASCGHNCKIVYRHRRTVGTNSGAATKAVSSYSNYFYYFRGMELKKSHFPIFILCCLLALLFSCKEDPESSIKESSKSYDALLQKAEKYATRQHYDSAFYFFNQSKDIAKEIQNPDKVVYALIRMAGLQQMQGDFSGSEASATESLDYLKTANPVYAIAIYNALGMVSKDLADYASAVRYYNFSLRLSKDALEKAIVKNNIAVVYLENRQYEKAIVILKPLLLQKAVAGNHEAHARILDNLGYAYFKTGTDGALPLLERSLQIRTKIKDDYGIIASYDHLAEYYSQNDSENAKKYSELAYQTATRINSAADRLETLGRLIKNAPENEVRKYSVIHVRLSDSLNFARQHAKNQFAKIRYDDAKTKVENANLKVDKIQIHNRSIIFGLLFCSAIIVGGISYIFIRKRHKKEKIIEGYKAETKISKKVHDELANDVYNVMTFAETKDLSDTENKESLLRNLDSVYARARDISRENSPVETGEYYPRQLREMLTEYSSQQTKVIISGFDSIIWAIVKPEKKMLIHRILQELMVNMKKHSQASIVALQFSQKGFLLEINYTDNGIGMAPESQFAKNGLRNVENRITAMGGKYIFESKPEKGLKINLQLHIK